SAHESSASDHPLRDGKRLEIAPNEARRRLPRCPTLILRAPSDHRRRNTHRDGRRPARRDAVHPQDVSPIPLNGHWGVVVDGERAPVGPCCDCDVAKDLTKRRLGLLAPQRLGTWWASAEAHAHDRTDGCSADEEGPQYEAGRAPLAWFEAAPPHGGHGDQHGKDPGDARRGGDLTRADGLRDAEENGPDEEESRQGRAPGCPVGPHAQAFADDSIDRDARQDGEGTHGQERQVEGGLPGYRRERRQEERPLSDEQGDAIRAAGLLGESDGGKRQQRPGVREERRQVTGGERGGTKQCESIPPERPDGEANAGEIGEGAGSQEEKGASAQQRRSSHLLEAASGPDIGDRPWPGAWQDAPRRSGSDTRGREPDDHARGGGEPQPDPEG